MSSRLMKTSCREGQEKESGTKSAGALKVHSGHWFLPPNPCATLPCSHRREGVTLIELLGTMSVLLAIAVSAAAMLTKVTGIGLQSKLATQSIIDVSRLAAMFRTDVHSSDHAALGEGGSGIELQIDQSSVRYQLSSDGKHLVRIDKHPDSEASVDRFVLTDRCQPEFTMDEQRITLRLTALDVRNPWIIEASRP